jgi:hypothetical protein
VRQALKAMGFSVTSTKPEKSTDPVEKKQK